MIRSLMILLLTSLFFFSCTGKSKPAKISGNTGETGGASNSSPAVAIDTFQTDIARYIAGMPTLGYFKDMMSDEHYWPRYSASVDSEWNAVEKSKIQPIDAWKKEYAITRDNERGTLFYPFAGPDILYAHTFFPEAANYIMVGLEPAGHIIDLRTMTKNERNNYLYSLDASLFSSNKTGFFHTKKMKVELKQHDLNGAIHPLLFYLARTGHFITAITPFELGKNGEVIGSKFSLSDTSSHTGLKIGFCDPGRTIEQFVYFLSFDLSDSHLKKHKEFEMFSSNLKPASTFLKAASYLLHLEEFSTVRKYILEKTGRVLQDDSGVPFRAFANDKWDVQLFGTYTKTISLFKNKFQPDYMKAMETKSVLKKMPFNIGYNVAHKECNLLVAVKK